MQLITKSYYKAPISNFTNIKSAKSTKPLFSSKTVIFFWTVFDDDDDVQWPLLYISLEVIFIL